jgi:hypothetical protein
MDETKKEWEEMLRYMLSDYRCKHPEDSSTDRELVESIMEHFYESGLVEKRNGKYLIGTLVDMKSDVVQ